MIIMITSSLAIIENFDLATGSEGKKKSKAIKEVVSYNSNIRSLAFECFNIALVIVIMQPLKLKLQSVRSQPALEACMC